MVDMDSADLILIVTASDLEKRVPLDRYRANLHTLMSFLPAHKTIYADFPIEPGREAYQAAFSRQRMSVAFGGLILLACSMARDAAWTSSRGYSPI